MACSLVEIEATTTDADRLVAQAQAGHHGALASLYRHYFPHVYAYLLQALKNHFDAEDATQHVFLKVFEGLPRYQLGGEPFKAWLFTLVRNHAIDRLRRASRVYPTDPHALTESRVLAETRVPARDTSSDEMDARILLERLPPLQRMTLRLLYVEDLQATQAAALLGRRPAAIRQLRRRALANLASSAGGAGARFGPEGRREAAR
ncbi:MAG: hypothetical protein QOJ29_1498 [Thermoleophilaceae bacterium]|nr:hypothetical protein [Thermoleophilaceae bacterium]